MRRVSLLLSKQQKPQYVTSVPAVAEFWNSCIVPSAGAANHNTIPNAALAKAQKAAKSLQLAAEESSGTPGNGSSASVALAPLSRHDAILHASINARVADREVNTTSASSSSSSSSAIPTPEFIYRRKTKEVTAESEKIYNAYLEYYNHIKFRNGWEKPVIPKGDELAEGMLHEAADISARIRARLDEESPTTKLRQADGSAQVFFNNTAEVVKLFNNAKAEQDENDKKAAAADAKSICVATSTAAHTDPSQLPSQRHRREFVKTLVLYTFKDAMGFVEGLTKSKIEKYFVDLSDFGFNPSAHAQHLLLEMLSHTEVARLSFDVVDAVKYGHDAHAIVSGGVADSNSNVSSTSSNASVSRRALDNARQARDNEHFCADGGQEDKLWRDAIGKLYKAHDALLLAVAERRRNAVKSVPGGVAVAEPASNPPTAAATSANSSKDTVNDNAQDAASQRTGTATPSSIAVV